MKFEEGLIYFNKIYVLQSLNENDRKTGTELHDDIISRRAWRNPNLETEIFEIVNHDCLITKLLEIKNECLNRNRIPFIHFETHGFKEGILLNSNEKVHWNEILPFISEINRVSKNNLFISVASCFGGYIQFVIDIKKPCPFRGFIGPMSEIFSEDLSVSFTEFFDKLLLTDDFENAISQLNSSNSSGVQFHYLNSEAFFDLVLKQNGDLRRNKRVNILANSFWNQYPNVKTAFGSFDNFKSFVENTDDNTTPQSIERLKRRFLHY